MQTYDVIVAGGGVALLLSLGLLRVIGTEFMPKLDEGNIWLTISLPPSTALERTKEIERDVRAVLRSYPEIHNVVTQVGRPDDGTDPKGPNNLEMLADLQPRETWRFRDKEALITDMNQKIHALPGIPTNFSQVIEDNVEETLSGVKGEIAVKVFGPDLEILTEKAEHIAEVLGSIRGAADVSAIPIGGQTEARITVERDRLARLGISVADVNLVVQTALAGASVSTFYEGDRQFSVTLRLATQIGRAHV